MAGFFEGKNVVNVSFENWMKWASGQSGASPRVMLPMIQRGSVWKPHKVTDLWDTLLRGMPVGAMMASEGLAGEAVVPIGVKRNTERARAGDINLIDGQQRTLAMLAGWPQGLETPLRPVSIWLDLTDKAQGEYKFRLWATTKAQPFGYARASMGGQALRKLERHKLRLANEAWGKHDAQTLWGEPGFMPWDAMFALPMTHLLANRDRLQAFIQQRMFEYKQAWEKKVAKVLEGNLTDTKKEIAMHFRKRIDGLPEDDQLVESIPALDAALGNVFGYEFPVIHVRRENFDDDNKKNDSPELNIDPPLAILFKRVGTGGEGLSNADYVYSIIKHHADGVHDMVESLLKDERIRAIYTPTSLVMSAVRLTMLTFKSEDGNGQKITDSAKLDKAAFARLVHNHPDFIGEFAKSIQPGGEFESRLKQVLTNLSYNDKDFLTGLPKHALCLIPIPLLETILVWHMLKIPTAEVMKQSRLPMVRFALQGNLCVMDEAKGSESAIKALKNDIKIADSDVFPDQALIDFLCAGEKPTAYPLPSPESLMALVDLNGLPLTYSPESINGLRGWTRFSLEESADIRQKKQAEIYKRWWNRKGGHVHPMLLWLQRDYVFEKFEKEPALAGMDEETPYDFDHILPSAQWSNWTGASRGKTFIDYPLRDGFRVQDKTGHWHIGNGIGNIHVLESSENRSLGDASVCVKLKKDKFDQNAQVFDKDLYWRKASGDESQPRTWDIDRALAFQRAVEQRTFALYSEFYKVLFPQPSQLNPQVTDL